MAKDDLSDLFKCVDVLFRDIAEKAVASQGGTFEDAHEGAWVLYKGGFLKLVGDDDHLEVEPCRNRAERRAVAKQNKPLADYRKRIEEANTGEAQSKGQ